MFKNKTTIALIAGIILVGSIFLAYKVHELATAHSTFENYYAFRGCQTLVDRTDTYGDCKLADGSAIKIVKFDGRWFLDGDLPECAIGIGSTCFVHWP